MKKPVKLLALSALAVLGYKAAKDAGIVDKVVYKKEYEAAKRYINAHHPHSRFTNLEKTDTGFVCVVTTAENKKIALTMTKASEGVYVFSEKQL